MGEPSNFFRDNDDLLFQWRHGLKWPELVGLTENDFTLPDGPKNLEEARAFYDDVLGAVGEFAAKEIAPKGKAIDEKGAWLEKGEVKFCPELDAIFAGMRELGLYGLTLPRTHGGSNAPMAAYFVASEVIARADVSVMTHFGFHGGIASALLIYSVKEGSAVFDKGALVKTRFDAEIQEIGEGKAFGCMVLTEPGAGSDLGAIRTRAKLVDGEWRLTGEKIFITSGHGQYNLVLAKTEDDGDASGLEGLKGLSLFARSW